MEKEDGETSDILARRTARRRLRSQTSPRNQRSKRSEMDGTGWIGLGSLDLRDDGPHERPAEWCRSYGRHASASPGAV